MTENIDPVAYNRAAWDREVDRGNEWTEPVGPDVTVRARSGDWSVVLIGYERVSRDWFPDSMAGAAVLCLASGGGQQGPVLAAAGAEVTVFDNSPRQLARDEEVAARDGLAIRTVLGDMRDLSAFADESFDLVLYIFDTGALDSRSELVVRHQIPFSTLDLPEAPHHADVTGRYLPGYFATRAVKPPRPS